MTENWWDRTGSLGLSDIYSLSESDQIIFSATDKYFSENKQIRLQRFTNTNWRLASYLWISRFNDPKYIIIHENNNVGRMLCRGFQDNIFSSLWPGPLSVWALGIILMSSAAPSNQKMCPPIPVPCQDVSLDMIDMSPANCHACHFKYFWYQFKNILHMTDNWLTGLITGLHNKC